MIRGILNTIELNHKEGKEKEMFKKVKKKELFNFLI